MVWLFNVKPKWPNVSKTSHPSVKLPPWIMEFLKIRPQVVLEKKDCLWMPFFFQGVNLLVQREILGGRDWCGKAKCHKPCLIYLIPQCDANEINHTALNCNLFFFWPGWRQYIVAIISLMDARIAVTSRAFSHDVHQPVACNTSPWGSHYVPLDPLW